MGFGSTFKAINKKQVHDLPTFNAADVPNLVKAQDKQDLINFFKLIVNLYRVKKYALHFSITEFRCHCNGRYCTGYPAYLSVNLLKNLEAIRVKFGGTKITSGIRCKKWNSLQTGSASASRHISGKAADIAGAFTKTNSQRNKVKSFWYSLKGSNFYYHGNRNMGNAVHCDVR